MKSASYSLQITASRTLFDIFECITNVEFTNRLTKALLEDKISQWQLLKFCFKKVANNGVLQDDLLSRMSSETLYGHEIFKRIGIKNFCAKFKISRCSPKSKEKTKPFTSGPVCSHTDSNVIKMPFPFKAT